MYFGQDALQQLFNVIVASQSYTAEKQTGQTTKQFNKCRCKKECHAQCNNVDSVVISLKKRTRDERKRFLSEILPPYIYIYNICFD